MSITQEILLGLSDETQDRVLGWLLRTGLLLRVPVFRTLLRSFEFFGAEPAELQRAFSEARDVGQSLIDSLCTLGHEIRFLAQLVDEAGDNQVARELYFRATLYYLAADWFSRDPRQYERNYAFAMPCFDRFRRLSTPEIEKVEFPYPVGAIAAHFRLPTVGHPPFPALVIIQGNDTVKEWLVAFEDLALARGIATLTIDQPGWGESGLTGNRLASSEDLRICSRLSIDFLQGRPDIRDAAVGIFGIGLGGLLALLSAGLEPRFAAAAGIGGTFFLNEVWRNLSALQRRRLYRHTGLATQEALGDWVDRMRIRDTLPQVRCPTLLVHGGKDEIASPSNAHALAAAVSGDAEVRVVDGGDHRCTQVLFKWTADYVFDWLSQCLARGIASLRVSPQEGTREAQAAKVDCIAMPFGQHQPQQIV
jgi:alpha-beta hydrolase superfamily lysophospholipase